LDTFVFDFANSRRIVWGRSGSNLTPCCNNREEKTVSCGGGGGVVVMWCVVVSVPGMTSHCSTYGGLNLFEDVAGNFKKLWREMLRRNNMA
jgi:hypothetical protein